MPRWLRVLILFLMVLSLVIYISPLQVEASAIGASIAGVTAVNVPAGLVFAAAAIALGVAAGTNDDFVNMVDNAVSAAGDWVTNGTVELLQTVNTLGQKTYFVAGQLFDDFRSWIYDEEIVYASMPGAKYYPANTKVYSKNSSGSYSVYDQPVYCLLYQRPGYGDYLITICAISGVDLVSTNSAGTKQTFSPSTYTHAYSLMTGYFDADFLVESGVPYLVDNAYKTTGQVINAFLNGTLPGTAYPITSSDLTLCYLPSSDTTLTDDTVVTFHPYLTKVIRTGGSGGSDNNGNPKWWVGLALAGSAAAAALKTQQEVYEDTQVEEIPDISYGQEFDFEYDTYIDTSEGTDNGVEKEYIIITPVETPGTGNTEGPEVTEPTTYPYPGTGTNPDTGDTTDPDPGDVTDPDAGDVTDPDSGGTDTGGDAGDGTGGNSGSWVPPQNHNQFALGDLTKFFPFCIPFDLYDFFTLLRADPVAPVLSWEIRDLSGQTYTLTVDLAEWDSVALLFRRLQLFLFICGLAAASRKYIKW